MVPLQIKNESWDFMNVVGIDVSKGKSTVCIINSSGEVQRPFNVQHSNSSLLALSQSIRNLVGETKIVLEYTGRFSEPVASLLHNQGLFVSAVNPLLIRRFGNNSLRNVKTDPADAKKIARYGLVNWSELREYTPSSQIRKELKLINRQYQLALKVKIMNTGNLVDLLEETFPNLRALFNTNYRKDGSLKWLDFAKNFWHVDCVRKHSLEVFIKRYAAWCKRTGYYFNLNKAEKIYNHAKNAIPIVAKTQTAKLLLAGAIKAVCDATSSLAKLRKAMNDLASQLPEYKTVMNMYGVGESLGPQLIAEIGDLSRFNNKRALAAYAGVDPQPWQSGKVNVRSNKTSKRGSPILRKVLFNIVRVIIRNAPAEDPIYLFIDKKRSEGKPYFVYMMAGANKFLRAYYGKVSECLQ